MQALFKLMKFLVGVLLVAGVIYFGGAQVLPDKIRTEHHVVVSAPPEKVFPFIATMQKFAEWSPWFASDEKVVLKFEGPEQGVGQKLVWTTSTPTIASGSQTVTNITDGQQVASDIEFAGLAKGTTAISLAATDKGTGVTWSYESPLVGVWQRWSALFNPPDVDAKIVSGLRKLKTLAEQAAT